MEIPGQISAEIDIVAAVAASIPAIADDRSESIWRNFRKIHPLHLQTIGLTDPSASGDRILVISEPPPLLPRATFKTALEAVFGSALKSAELKRNQIGLDGWVEDVVATLSYPRTSDGEHRLESDMTVLAQRLFGTSYKFAPIRLSDTPSDGIGRPLALRPKAPPSLQVTAAELDSWLFSSTSLITGLDTAREYKVDDLLAGGDPGVYFSHKRGIVLLLLPRDEFINIYRSAIREFTLDSDAIIGAVASDKHRVLIVGRERDTPVSDVPPLRVETILALAATRERELGQSYERNAPFAGELSEGELQDKDWAPIYLSHDLFNTEFGSLLNITDQLLKSWSMAGKIRYINFNYFPATKYPFPDGVVDVLKAEKLTFNWNTTGVGSVLTYPNKDIFTILKTGSLPVSYCPGETCTETESPEVTAAEEKAYDWFSGLQDPNLARVVQYASLYQIFRAFPVKSFRDEPPPPNFDAGTKSLETSVSDALQLILKSDYSEIMADWLAQVEDQTKNMSQEERQFTMAMARTRADRVQEALTSARDVLREMEQKCDRTAIPSLVAQFANRQGEAEPITCEPSFDTSLDEIIDRLREVLPIVKSDDDVRQSIIKAARQIETGYIKTPSVVLSWTEGVEGVGGHNLYGWSTRIETKGDVLPGTVRIEGEGENAIIAINPADSSHSSELARAFERKEGQTDAEMTAILRQELSKAKPIRTPDSGLGLSNVPTSEGRGLSTKLEGDLALGELGERPALNGSELITQYQADATARHLDLLVTRSKDGYNVLRYEPPPAVSTLARSEPAMLEALGNFARQAAKVRRAAENPVRIGYSSDFSTGEIRAINFTQEMRAAASDGGGLVPPSPPPGVLAATPDAGRPNGFFFVNSARSGEERVGYAAKEKYGDAYTLESVEESNLNSARSLLLKSVRWDKAKITELRPIENARYAGYNQINFEVELPISESSWTQSLGLRPRDTFLLRIYNFFKRPIGLTRKSQLGKKL
jgi:hypothetical protein